MLVMTVRLVVVEKVQEKVRESVDLEMSEGPAEAVPEDEEVLKGPVEEARLQRQQYILVDGCQVLLRSDMREYNYHNSSHDLH